MIRHAQNKDIQALKAIWQEVFGDDKTFIDAFFEELFNACEVLCWEENQQLCAMLYKIPCTLELEKGKREKACYLYALATLAPFRKKGIMQALIERAIEEGSQQEVKHHFLIPASSSLFTYYEKFGFKALPALSTYTADLRDFSLNHDLVDDKWADKVYIKKCGIDEEANDKINNVPAYSLKEISPQEMCQRLNKPRKYSNINVYFSEAVQTFYLKDWVKMPGGKLYCIENKGKEEGVLIGRAAQELFEIMQYSVEHHDFEGLLEALKIEGSYQTVSVIASPFKEENKAVAQTISVKAAAVSGSLETGVNGLIPV